jgi:sucrose synthase
MQITRLLPDAVGTTCGDRLEKVYDTEYCHILRVPFRTEKGIVRKWISRFEVWPYLETFSEVKCFFINLTQFMHFDVFT